MIELPQKVRITNLGWNEDRGAFKVQIGTHEETIAYAWVVAGGGDKSGYEKAMLIAQRICEGWNTWAETK